MQELSVCPSCESQRLRPYSFTVPAERDRHTIHYAQTRCRECDLVFSNPVADADELEQFYRSTYYEDVVRDYNAGRPDLEEAVRQRAQQEAEGLRRSVLPYVSGGTFFEIGTSFGGLLEGARLLGFEVAGSEPSASAARFARETLGLGHVRQGSFDSRDWPEAFCDVVYSYMVIEHVADLNAFVDGMFRILKPGGLAVLGTENHHNAWVMVRRVRSWLKKRRLPEFQTSDHHTFYFSDRSLRRLLERHGFAVFKCLVYSPPIAEKLPNYRFRSWRSKLAFYALHYADDWTGRGGRVLVWCRKL